MEALYYFCLVSLCCGKTIYLLKFLIGALDKIVSFLNSKHRTGRNRHFQSATSSFCLKKIASSFVPVIMKMTQLNLK